MNRESSNLKAAENMSVNLDAEFHQSIKRIKLQLLWFVKKILKL